MLKVFVDTEFTNFIDTELISIGLVSEFGQEFYAEVPFTEPNCSPFVHEVVIPLLGTIADSKYERDELKLRLSNWLEMVRPTNQDVQICFDYQTDWDLFADVLDYEVPEWCHSRLIARNINSILKYEFYKRNNLVEHHALYDARANCFAFVERAPVTF